MAGLNIAFEIGKRALFSQQTAVNVTGHNIANVNTPDFSRQRTALVPGHSINSSGRHLGTGVQVAMVERVYDCYLAAQISAQVQGKRKAEAEKHVLAQVESILAHVSLACASEGPKPLRWIKAGVPRLVLTMASEVATSRCRYRLCTPLKARRYVRRPAPAPSQVLPWTSRMPSPSASHAHAWLPWRTVAWDGWLPR
jgi:hypothetical protein